MLAHTGSGGGRKCMTDPADGPDAATCPPRTAPTPPPVLRQATTAHSTPKKPDAGSALSRKYTRTGSGRQLARPRPAKSEASGLTIWLPSADSRPRLPPALPRFMSRPSSCSPNQDVDLAKIDVESILHRWNTEFDRRDVVLSVRADPRTFSGRETVTRSRTGGGASPSSDRARRALRKTCCVCQ